MAERSKKKEEKILTYKELKNKYLPNKIVTLKATPRKGKMVNDPKHDAFFMMEGSNRGWVLPRSRKSPGPLLDPFKGNLEEKQFFEDELNEDLSTNNAHNPYWGSFNVTLIKNKGLLSDGIDFDLSNPLENLKVKILSLQPDIAVGWDNRLKRPAHNWVLIDKYQNTINDSAEADKKSKAYEHYIGIKSSEQKLKDFLKIYGATNNIGKAVPRDVKKDFLVSEVYNIIEQDLDNYLAIVDGGLFEFKVLVNDALEAGAIVKKGTKYYLPGLDPINAIDASYTGTVEELSRWSDESHDKHEAYQQIRIRVQNLNK